MSEPTEQSPTVPGLRDVVAIAAMAMSAWMAMAADTTAQYAFIGIVFALSGAYMLTRIRKMET